MIPGTDIAVKTIGLSLLGILFIWAVIIHFKRKNSLASATAG
jgi:hypothetical protein